MSTLDNFIQYSEGFPLSADYRENFAVWLMSIPDRKKREEMKAKCIEFEKRDPYAFARWFSGNLNLINEVFAEYKNKIAKAEGREPNKNIKIVRRKVQQE
jgi:hypothetical protein